MTKADSNYETNRKKILFDCPYKKDTEKSIDSAQYDTAQNLTPRSMILRGTHSYKSGGRLGGYETVCHHHRAYLPCGNVVDKPGTACSVSSLSKKYSPRKNRVCHGWSGGHSTYEYMSGFHLRLYLSKLNRHMYNTRTIASAPAETGSVFML